MIRFNKEGVTDAATLGWYKGQYHVEPNYQMLSELYGFGDPSGRKYADENRTASFFTRSVGPDQDRFKERSHPYDITNGLLSHGTILRPIPGSPNNQYPYVRR